jgi:hypothetical protein
METTTKDTFLNKVKLRLAAVVSVLVILGTFATIWLAAFMPGSISETIIITLITIINTIASSIFGYSVGKSDSITTKTND